MIHQPERRPNEITALRHTRREQLNEQVVLRDQSSFTTPAGRAALLVPDRLPPDQEADAQERAAQQTALLTLPSGDVVLSDKRWLRRGQQFPGGLKVIATLDPTPRGTLLHVSLSYARRDPSWDDLKQIRYAFYPADIDVMLVLPRIADYVNVHEHCFQLWQCPAPWGLR